MNKNITKIFLAIGLVFPNLTFAAMENAYPPIPVSTTKTLVIDAGSSSLDYIMYFYAFFLAIATVIAVMVMVWAGLEMVMSSGEPGKVASARNRGVGALIGLGIIMGSYIILNVISTSLSNPAINPLSCGQSSVCVETHKETGGKEKILSATSLNNIPNLGLVGNDRMVIKKYVGLKEIWGFSDVNYQGTPQLVGGYRDDNTDNLLNELPTELTIDSNIKSIKVYNKQLGAYLYDSPNFTASRLAPLFLSRSSVDLGEYKDKVRSIQFLNDKESKYYAVAFALTNYNGSYDYNFYPQQPSSGCSEVIDKDKAVSSNTESILLFRSKTEFLAEPVSGIVFYDILNCDNLAPESSCPAPTGSLFGSQSINCSGFEQGDVLSVRVTKQAGVLMFSDDSKYCQFFDITYPNRVSGDCISNDIFFKKKIAGKFIVIPYENKL